MAQTTRSRSTNKGSTSRSGPKASKKSGVAKTVHRKGRQRERQSSHEHHAAAVQVAVALHAQVAVDRAESQRCSFKDTAVNGTKGGGRAVADAASKAKLPLIAGGTAIVGAATGVVLKDRLGASKSKNPLNRLGGMSMPKSVAKLDLDTVKSAADRVSAYGQQASDIASAIEKTRKESKQFARGVRPWARLVSNQRRLGCEAVTRSGSTDASQTSSRPMRSGKSA